METNSYQTPDDFSKPTSDEAYVARVTPVIALEQRVIGPCGPYYLRRGYFEWLDSCLFRTMLQIDGSALKATRYAREHCWVMKEHAHRTISSMSVLIRDFSFAILADAREREDTVHYFTAEAIGPRLNNQKDALKQRLRQDYAPLAEDLEYSIDRCSEILKYAKKQIEGKKIYSPSMKSAVVETDGLVKDVKHFLRDILKGCVAQ